MTTKSRTGSQFTTDNQLSLFSDTELADNLREESLHDPNAADHTPWMPDLEHWRRQRPRMVEDLERRNYLQTAIFAAQELTGNLLYELTVVQKMDYHRAWEIATKEWAFLPDEVEAEVRPATPEEKAALVKYTGWRALPNAFAPQPPEEWQSVADELKDLLNAEEYASARASTPNGRYTSPEVVQANMAGAGAVRPAARHAGLGAFDGCRALLWLMPETLHSGTRRTGVELDSVTARIAAALYPESTVHRKAFEDALFPKDYFDAAVENIPFG